MDFNRITSALRDNKKIVISFIIVLFVLCEFIFRFDNVHHSLVLIYRVFIFQIFLWLALCCFPLKLHIKLYIIGACAFINLGIYCFYIDYYRLSLFKESYYLITANVTKVEITNGSRGSNIYISYEYNWLTGKVKNSHINVSGEVKKDNIIVGTKLFMQKHENGYGRRLKYNISKEDAYYYQYPVLFIENKEVGNDYYYYAKLRPELALKNFGLRRVSKSIVNSDTLLYYTNLNDSIDNQNYLCADTLQTAANRALVGSSYAFLFHDGIYTKEQVFEEIPQAKEYYLKYSKEFDSILNGLNNTR